MQPASRQTGFTLVELAIVLVIIGLILGMAFKGKDLIDGAKVKNMQAQYNKIVAGFNIYYEKYGAYPGDGCATAPAAGATTCPATGRNGLINGATESAAAMTLLMNTNILTSADVRSVFGQDWVISDAATTQTGYASNTNYLTLTSTATAAADVRFVCALDRLMDDGVNSSGIVRSAGQNYTATDDCWALSGQVSIGIRVLP
ncbi:MULTISPECIES: type II secretion system protein [Chitinibacter]|uniref:type II secretion system protein n=1 Tax=Chitinibacter TaxID=230666 RepID=UPI000414F373|nr:MULTISPECIES: prepilin-type N-terminal cleavage/methylation domain-containing protein [Chitinibacter]